MAGEVGIFEFWYKIMQDENAKFNFQFIPDDFNNLSIVNDSNFDLPHDRCGFVYKYGTCTMSFIIECMKKFITESPVGLQILKDVCSQHDLKLCSLSIGPCIDYFAFMIALRESGFFPIVPNFKTVKHITKFGAWRNTVKLMQRNIVDGTFSRFPTFLSTDGNIVVVQGSILENFPDKLKLCIDGSHVVLMVKLLNLTAPVEDDSLESSLLEFLEALDTNALLFCIDTKPSISMITNNLSKLQGKFLYHPTHISTALQMAFPEYLKAIYGCLPVQSARGSFFVWQKTDAGLHFPHLSNGNMFTKAVETRKEECCKALPLVLLNGNDCNLPTLTKKAEVRETQSEENVHNLQCKLEIKCKSEENVSSAVNDRSCFDSPAHSKNSSQKSAQDSVLHWIEQNHECDMPNLKTENSTLDIERTPDSGTITASLGSVSDKNKCVPDGANHSVADTEVYYTDKVSTVTANKLTQTDLVLGDEYTYQLEPNVLKSLTDRIKDLLTSFEMLSSKLNQQAVSCDKKPNVCHGTYAEGLTCNDSKLCHCAHRTCHAVKPHQSRPNFYPSCNYDVGCNGNLNVTSCNCHHPMMSTAQRSNLHNCCMGNECSSYHGHLKSAQCCNCATNERCHLTHCNCVSYPKCSDISCQNQNRCTSPDNVPFTTPSFVMPLQNLDSSSLAQILLMSQSASDKKQ